MKKSNYEFTDEQLAVIGDVLLGAEAVRLVALERFAAAPPFVFTAAIIAPGDDGAGPWLTVYPDGTAIPIAPPQPVTIEGLDLPLTDAQERRLDELIYIYAGNVDWVAHETGLPDIGPPYGNLVLRVGVRPRKLVRVTWHGLVDDENYIPLRLLNAAQHFEDEEG